MGAGPTSGETDPSSEKSELGAILMSALTKAGVKIEDLIGHVLADDRPSVRRELRTLSEGGGGGKPSDGDGPPSADGERDPLQTIPLFSSPGKMPTFLFGPSFTESSSQPGRTTIKGDQR